MTDSSQWDLLNPRKFCQENVKREDHDHIVPIMRSQSHQHDQPLAEITAPLKQELILGTKRSPISWTTQMNPLLEFNPFMCFSVP